MTIAIAAATSQLGRLAIAALKRRDPQADLIGLVRNPEKAADLGVTLRRADYHDRASLDAALQGVQTLVLISSGSFEDRVGQHVNAIAAAKTAKVGRVIYTSVLKGDASPMQLAADHIATEAALKSSGLTYTLLRNGWYSENYTGSLAGAIAAGAMIGATPTGRISPAARADYAEAIAAVALGSGHDNAVYELAGDQALTLPDLAAEVSRQTGKTIPYSAMPAAAYADVLRSFGLPEPLPGILADCDACAERGALLDESRALSRLIGRPTTPMADSVAAALAAA